MADPTSDFYNIPPVVVEKLATFQKQLSSAEIKIAALEQANNVFRRDNEALKQQVGTIQQAFERQQAQMMNFVLRSELRGPQAAFPDMEAMIYLQVKQATREFTDEFKNVYDILRAKPSKRAVQSALYKRSEWFQTSFYQLRENLQLVLKEKADVDAVNEALRYKTDIGYVYACLEELQNTLIAAIPQPQEQHNLGDIEVRVYANTAKITQLEAGNTIKMGKNYQDLLDQLQGVKRLLKQKADYSQLLQVQTLVNEASSDVELMRELTKRPTVQQVVEICQGMMGKK